MALKPTAELIAGLRSRLARVAVTASTLRSLPADTAPVARRFLRELPLKPFAVQDRAEFDRALDSATERFVKELPPGCRHWGVARKFLNIYVRECAYNAHLRSAFQLGPAERYLEVPLDGVVAEQLALPGEKWTGLAALTPQKSAAYQKAAATLAENRRTRRVHLDVELWSLSRD
jgi:hypothetical protein